MPPNWANPLGSRWTQAELRRTVQALEGAKGSQKSLAQSLGVTARTVRRWKSGGRDVLNSPLKEKIIRRARYEGVGRWGPDVLKPWRSSAICAKTTKDDFGQETLIEIETFLVTEGRHTMADTERVFSQAITIFRSETQSNFNCQPNIEQPKRVHPREIDSFGRSGFVTFGKASGKKTYEIDFQAGKLKGPI